MQRTAVIGFGCAGYHAVKTMREKGYQGEIHVYCNADEAPSNPMLTTYYVAGKIPFDGMFPFGKIDSIRRKYDLVLHRNAQVTGLSPEARMITLSDGHTASFDNIVLATGARAIVPPLEGMENPNIFCMRTVEDAQLLKARLEKGDVRSAVVIGASMVGIKLVELLADRGISCTLADMAPRIFPTAALPDVAEAIEARVAARGVDLRFSCGIAGVSEDAGRLSARFGDGSEIPCDLVLLCIGTRANTQLAGNSVAVNRGIVVDERMRTSAPGIYAAGDCCEGNNLLTGETQIIGLWDNAARQGATAGADIAGAAATHPGNLPHNITHFMGMDFIGLGDNRCDGTRYSYTRDGLRIEVVAQGGHPVCVNVLDAYQISGVLKSYLFKRIAGVGGAIDDIGRARLQSEGIPVEFIDLLEGLN